MHYLVSGKQDNGSTYFGLVEHSEGNGQSLEIGQQHLFDGRLGSPFVSILRIIDDAFL